MWAWLRAKRDSDQTQLIEFTPSTRAFFVRVAPPEEFWELLRIRRVAAVNAVFERGSEFPLSLKERLGRSRILRSLYSNGLSDIFILLRT
ncbi:hypothetical protein AVEN_55803-1 [Araneus ventricosus]|uniref:Uncharacterized protein n=1 Tax=Araneus ventricosus TaxID=182803 RepID=A0A4Y2RQW4_ARAVE|nr:hypothetical protein AVEN_55803-1 [Araneus ventricosus]